MLTRTHLFGLSTIAPNTMEEVTNLHSFIEASIAHNVVTVSIKNAIDIPDIYCNRIPIYQISLVEKYSPYFMERHEILSQLNRQLERVVEDAVMEYYIKKMVYRTLCLNIEFCIINRNSTVVSFDIYGE